MIDEGEEGAVTTVIEGFKEGADVLWTDDVRKRFVAFWFDLIPDLPLLAEVVTKESLESLLGLVNGGAGKLTHVLAMDEKVLNLRCAQFRDVKLRVVPGELANPSRVVLDGFRAQSCKLDKAKVILIPIFRSEAVILSVFLT